MITHENITVWDGQSQHTSRVYECSWCLAYTSSGKLELELHEIICGRKNHSNISIDIEVNKSLRNIVVTKDTVLIVRYKGGLGISGMEAATRVADGLRRAVFQDSDVPIVVMSDSINLEMMSLSEIFGRHKAKMLLRLEDEKLEDMRTD